MADLLTWEDKINNPELLAFLEQYGETEYLTAVEINLVRDAINFLNTKRLPVKSGQKLRIAKGYGNISEDDEVGDLFMGWTSPTEFNLVMRWDGGVNYSKGVFVEFDN